jgi:hypothetical protein
MKQMSLPNRGPWGSFFWSCPARTWELLCRANYLIKSEVGLHLSLKRAMVYALPRIKVCWTGRDWAISHPLDNLQKKDPHGLLMSILL